ncbi:MAG: hypothetical protein V5A62_07100 [Haloarculaceae archaeon]
MLGTEIRVVDDDEFLAVGTVLRNRSDRYLTVAVDRYDVAHEAGVAGSIEPFAGIAASSSEGLAFAPGERQRVRLHDKIPPETTGARLRGAVRVRSLPDEVLAVPVELSNWTPSPGFEHRAVNLSVENGAEPAAPVVVGRGRFGGMSLADPEGTEFVEDRWFDGTLAGGTYYDDATAIPPGEPTRERRWSRYRWRRYPAARSVPRPGTKTA